MAREANVPYKSQRGTCMFCSLSHEWLKSAKLKAETEGLLIAAQDQSLTMSS